MINIKKIFSLEINYLLKHILEFLFIRKKIDVDNNKRKVYFLDAPSYGNIGDQAIAFAMEQMMETICDDYQFIEIQEDVFAQYFYWLKNNVKTSDIICLTGGGNLGDLYPKYEAIRRLVIKTFKNNIILVFPQTYTYGTSNYSKQQEENSKKVYNSASNLILMAREEMSFKKMKKQYPNCQVLLTHDIVLSLNYTNAYKRSNTIGLCLREDKEKVIDQDLVEKINKTCKNAKKISTTKNLKYRVTNIDRKELVENTLKEFAENKLVITDRLHGMIFSYITNTPCICMPNSTGKVEGVYNYLKDKGNIKMVNKVSDDFVIYSKFSFNKCVDFEELIKNLKNIIERSDKNG